MGPYGAIVHGRHANDVLSMDFVFTGPSTEGVDRVLLLTDAYSNWSLPFLATSENAAVVADAYITWCAQFGPPGVVLMDSSPAFLNRVMDAVAKRTGAKSHFTTPHAHGAHGRQERLNKTFGTTLRSLLTEHQMDSTQWPRLLDAVVYSLNHTPFASLAGHAPVELFTGLRRANPVATALLQPYPPKLVGLDANAPAFAAALDSLRDALATYAVDVNRARDKRVHAAAEARAAKPYVHAPDFGEGDWVLVRKAGTAGKFHPLWSLARVVRPGSKTHGQTWVVRFEHSDPARRTEATIHADRLKLLDAASYERTPELDELIEYLGDKTYKVERVLGLRKTKYGLDVQIKWENYAKPEWHELRAMHDQVPHIIRDFLDAGLAPPRLIKEARAAVDANV